MPKKTSSVASIIEVSRASPRWSRVYRSCGFAGETFRGWESAVSQYPGERRRPRPISRQRPLIARFPLPPIYNAVKAGPFRRLETTSSNRVHQSRRDGQRSAIRSCATINSSFQITGGRARSYVIHSSSSRRGETFRGRPGKLRNLL